MDVRAKFKVNAIEYTEGSKPKVDNDGKPVMFEGRQVYGTCEMATIKMNPVYGGGDPNHENTKFWQSSPGGQLSLNCVNADATKCFVLGKEYYVDFTRAA